MLLNTTLVVFLPTPFKLSKKFLSFGTYPSGSNLVAISIIFSAFLLYDPILFIISFISSILAFFNLFKFGYFSNNTFVTSLTLLSVVWALNIVAISNS